MGALLVYSSQGGSINTTSNFVPKVSVDSGSSLRSACNGVCRLRQQISTVLLVVQSIHGSPSGVLLPRGVNQHHVCPKGVCQQGQLPQVCLQQSVLSQAIDKGGAVNVSTRSWHSDFLYLQQSVFVLDNTQERC